MAASCWVTCTRRVSSPTIRLPATVQVAGRGFTLGSANVAQAALTAQAHDLVERSALGSVLTRIEPVPAPDEALLAVHTAEYLDRLRAASAGGPWDGEYAPVTPGHLGGGPADRRAACWPPSTRSSTVEYSRALAHVRPGLDTMPSRIRRSPRSYLNNLACGLEHVKARGV